MAVILDILKSVSTLLNRSKHRTVICTSNKFYGCYHLETGNYFSCSGAVLSIGNATSNEIWTDIPRNSADIDSQRLVKRVIKDKFATLK